MGGKKKPAVDSLPAVINQESQGWQLFNPENFEDALKQAHDEPVTKPTRDFDLD